MGTNATVNVTLTGNAAGLSAALRTGQRELLSFSNTLKAGFGISIGATLAQAILSLGERIRAGINDAETFAGRLTDLSRAADLGAEPFQVLGRSAKLTGAEMSDVTKAIVDVGEKARDALVGNGGAAGAFAQLGINVQEFIALAPERRIEALGAALVGAQDPAAAFSAIIELLGTKNGPKLRAMLEELGSEGIDKLAADMAEAGLLMREDTIATLDAAGDKAEDSATRFRNAWADVAVAVQPIKDVMHDLGTLAARAASGIVLSLEKIGIAGSQAGQMIKDAFSGEFKGIQHYNDEAERLAAEAEARANKRRTAPIVETKPAPKQPIEPLVVAAESKVQLEDVADDVERAQRQASIDLARIGRDFTSTNEQKRQATLAVLREQAREIDAAQTELDAIIERLAKADPRFEAMQKAEPGRGVASIAEELSRGPGANKDLAAAVDARERLTDTQSGVTQQMLNANQDPRTVGEGVNAALTSIETRWGSLATQMRDSFSSIGDALNGGIAGGMEQLLGTTEQWSQKLGAIGGPVMGAVSQAISKMFSDWMTGRAAAMAKNILFSTKEGAADATAKAPGALFGSISSFGAAAAIGIAAFLGAKALAGGFFEGGFTGLGNPHDPAGIVHKGEFVIPHDVTAKIGPGALAGLVDYVRNPSQSVDAPEIFSQAPGYTASSRAGEASEDSAVPPMRILAVFDDGSESMRDKIEKMASHPAFRTHVMRVTRNGKAELGIPM